MPQYLHEHRIAYFDIPKVASSSIKLAFYEIAHGPNARDFKNPDDQIHFIYPTKRVTAADLAANRDYWSFAVLRDPTERLLSAYANRIAHHRDQYRGRMTRLRARLLGLPMEPDIDTFFIRLARYRMQAGRVRHHTDLAAHYIGADLARFDAIYTLKDLPALEAELSARTGHPVRFRRLQTGGARIGVEALSPAAFEQLMAYLRPEYELLADYFSPPAPRLTAAMAAQPARS